MVIETTSVAGHQVGFFIIYYRKNKIEKTEGEPSHGRGAVDWLSGS
jgi:hypothetical protein